LEKKKLLIIDGNGLAYRCLYTHGDLGFRENEGEQWLKKESKFIYTGMTYGFLVSLIMMNKEIEPDSIVIAWDGGSKYRQDLYPGYKSKRKEKRKEEKKKHEKLIKDQVVKKDPNFKPPHNVNRELDQVRELIHYTGLQQFRKQHEEADDIIGTLVKKFHKEYSITIASNDHDFLQLLNYDDIRIFRSTGFKKEFIYKKNFIKKHGILPKYYPNVLAIGGDSTDEYPGVKGVSTETAFEIVKKYGPELEKILEKARSGKITEARGVGRLISEQKDMAILCKKLAKIKTDVELLEEKSKFDENSLINIFKKYKFHSLLFDDKMSEIKKFKEVLKLKVGE
jgi:DNA polymerase-1